MKRSISLILSVVMCLSLGLFLGIGISAESDMAPEILTMYVSNDGFDYEDGLTETTAKRTLNSAIDYMVENRASFDEAVIMLVGDLTVADTSYEKQLHLHTFPLTITSSSKQNNRLLLDAGLRIGGETLFTNIKVLNTSTRTDTYLWAEGYRLTMGKKGVVNDVITYDATSGKPALSIAGASPNLGREKDIDVTINSGTYLYLNTSTAAWGDKVGGNVNFVINDATINGGAITLGGGLKGNNYLIADNTGFKGSINDYTVVINGGSFTDTDIIIGLAATGGLGDGNNKVTGDTVVDINGGSFNNCEINMGDYFVSMSGAYHFEKGVIVDFTDIPLAQKSSFVSMINTVLVSNTLQKNKITIVQHSYNKYEDVNNTQHRYFCGCGCTETSKLESHKWDEGEIITPPTHSQSGEIKYTCICGKTVNDIIPEVQTTTHTHGAWEPHNDTQHKAVCTVFGCDNAKYADHRWDDGVLTKLASHTEDGSKTFTCNDCGAAFVQILEKTKFHTMGRYQKVDAEQHKNACDCGYERYSVHKWDEGAVTTAATETADGVKTYTCTDCGEIKTDVIPNLSATAETSAQEQTTSDTQKANVGGCGSNILLEYAFISGVAVIAFAAIFVRKKNNYKQ